MIKFVQVNEVVQLFMEVEVAVAVAGGDYDAFTVTPTADHGAF